MPLIIPIGGEFGGSPEVPKTFRFPLYASVLIGSRIDSSNLAASVEIASGEGPVAICDTISDVLDSAR